jgi:hypothetical protein
MTSPLTPSQEERLKHAQQFAYAKGVVVTAAMAGVALASGLNPLVAAGSSAVTAVIVGVKEVSDYRKQLKDEP